MPLLSSLIRRPVLVCMLFAGSALLGAISYTRLPVELYPNAELPMLILRVNGSAEMSPGYVESQAVIPLEGAAASLAGVDKIVSYADTRGGMVYVYFTRHTSIKYTFLKLQEKVAAVALPEEFRASVVKVNAEQAANQFMTLELRGSGGIDRIREVADRDVAAQLESVDGIAGVQVFGGRSKTLDITLHEEACRAHNVTLNRVRSLLRSANLSRQFAGALYDGDRRLFVNVTAEFRDLSEIGSIVVDRAGPVLLKDIATITFGYKEPTSRSRVNGGEALTIQLARDAQVNLIALSRRVRAVVRDLNGQLAGKDVTIAIRSDTAAEMEKNINLIMRLALGGGLLAVWVLWIFLRNLRLVAIITLAIPLSVLGAFNFFYAFGVTINTLTLVGLALAVGMLVDNSIVVLENIYRLVALRVAPGRAVVQGTMEVWRSIVASTLTTICVFLPFVFASDSAVRLIGKHVGVAIIATMLVSLAVALVFIPAIAQVVMTGGHDRSLRSFRTISSQNRFMSVYRLFLKTGMRYPVPMVLAAAVAFLASLGLSATIDSQSSGQDAVAQLRLYVTMPAGATLDKTDAAVQALESRLDSIEGKPEVVSAIYEDEATVTITPDPEYIKQHRDAPARIKADLQKRIQGFSLAAVSFDAPGSSSRYRGDSRSNPGARLDRLLGADAPGEKIIVRGNDFERIEQAADDVRYHLENLTTLQSVQVNLPGRRPEVHMRFDVPLMSEYGISLQSVAGELSGFQSQLSAGVTYKQGADEYDISIRSDAVKPATAKTMHDLRTQPIADGAGADHELQEFSRIIYANGQSTISRVNQERQVEVTYRFTSDVLASKDALITAREEIDALIASLTFPAGIFAEPVHDESNLSEFHILIAIATILIYMILASVFESLYAPLVMMFSIPLAAVGSLALLFLSGTSLMNANTLMGMLILLGVVVNNGIILLDQALMFRKRGFRIGRALMTAGQSRMRPIFITAFTTMAGMVPLALGKAERMLNIGAPFAITVIGGLAGGTLLTLVFIPAAFSGFESSLAWLRSLDWRVKTFQGVAIVAGWCGVFAAVDDPFWKLADCIVILVLVPSLTYFVRTSLRRAAARPVDTRDAVVIEVRNVQKLYGLGSRFARGWHRIMARGDEHAKTDPGAAFWQVPMLAFLVYYVYSYLTNGFAVFVLSHVVYFFLLYVMRCHMRRLLTGPDNAAWRAIGAISFPIVFWGVPSGNLAVFLVRWRDPGLVAFIGCVWYFLLLVYYSARRLEGNPSINVLRLTGRFAGFRSRWYRFVLRMPVIGMRSTPFPALNGVSLRIGHGMFGLLGPNGAGKTTLMRIISGIFGQSYGKIFINGIDTQEKREELQGLIGYLPQEFGSYGTMTAHEYLDYQAILKGLTDTVQRRERVGAVLCTVHMEEHATEKISSFSGGMKQRIGIAQILLHLPRILIVDEPTAGLDPQERVRFRNLLVELSRDRVVILSTHIIEDISSSCNQLAVLEGGLLRFYGRPQDMTAVAEGKVWHAAVSQAEFERLSRESRVIHHVSQGATIRARCLSDTKPHPEAELAKPSLEDAYLWMLKERHHA